MAETVLKSVAADCVRALPPGTRLIDVRKRPAAETSGEMVVGATWTDPMRLGFDHPILNAEALVFYCVHGHEVSQFATALARVAGIDARFVAGGFEALRAEGLPLQEWRP